MDESESRKEDHNREKRRFSQEQYDMLKRCSDKKDMTEWNEWRKKKHREPILLEGVDLKITHLEKADLFGAHLENAELQEANLKGACLSYAHLENAKLGGAHVKDAMLSFSRLQRTSFDLATVDSWTMIYQAEVDRNTDFRGVGLDAIRIDPGTKQLLEYNIRRKNWEEWYKEHPNLKWVVKPFWLMNDYGLSTARIIVIFFGAAFIFANIYYHWGRIASSGIVDNLFVDRSGVSVSWWVVPLRALYFSIITMTLGFSDMYANAHSIWGYILVTIQALLGYVLLGALVTRFAVLFTAGGPAGKFADDKKEKATESTERHRENR